jgi:hypothetical protein
MEPIERHIKEHFDNKSYSYNEAHWLEAQKLIAENKRRRRGWLYWWTGGVGVMLFAFIAFWTFSEEIRVITDTNAGQTEAVKIAQLNTNQSENSQRSQEIANENSDNVNNGIARISQSNTRSFKNEDSSSNTQNRSTKFTNSGENNNQKTNSGVSESKLALNQEFTVQGNQPVISSKNALEKHQGAGETESAEQQVQNPLIAANDKSDSDDAQKNLMDESNAESLDAVSKIEDVIPVENAAEQMNLPTITPVSKNTRFGWGFVAGYLLQKQSTEDQWINGAYLGARASWTLSPKWSIGSELTMVIQEIQSVHLQHDVVSGYGFGRDSIVTDLYAKRAIALQIPLAVSYAIGKHSFTGMIGSRILLDAKARLEKLHYTNADPENTGPGVIVSRSTVVIKKEQLMPRGALSPFSIYTGIRYGWMIGKGWGLETNVSLPLFHKKANLDFGTKMAADQGIRLELGVMKVF